MVGGQPPLADTRSQLILSVSDSKCSRCRAGEPVACDGWRTVVDTAASDYYREPRLRKVRCDFYLQRFAKECAEKAAAEANLPLAYARVDDPHVDPRLSDLPPLSVVYPNTIDPKIAWQVAEITKAAVWYHAQAGHRPWLWFVPATQFDDLSTLRQRLTEDAAVFLDRWDGGELHPKLVPELCALVEQRLDAGQTTVVSLVRPVADLQPRVEDEAMLIYRLQQAAAVDVG